MKLLIVAVALIASSGTAHQSRPDVKGWQGTEWGMPHDRVTQVLNLPLSEAPPGGQNYCDPDHKGSVLKSGAPLKLGPNDATVFLCLGASSGLEAVALVFDDGLDAFQRVRDELKANYGDPVSETGLKSLAGGTVTSAEAKWLLPSTVIHLQVLGVPGKSRLTVTYSRRPRSVL